MNDLCVEIGYNSINHVGEELCGDHVEAVGQGEDSSVLVLADGLGSGVKANILSILTSRIISTMIAEGLPLEECGYASHLFGAQGGLFHLYHHSPYQ